MSLSWIYALQRWWFRDHFLFWLQSLYHQPFFKVRYLKCFSDTFPITKGMPLEVSPHSHFIYISFRTSNTTYQEQHKHPWSRLTFQLIQIKHICGRYDPNTFTTTYHIPQLQNHMWNFWVYAWLHHINHCIWQAIFQLFEAWKTYFPMVLA